MVFCNSDKPREDLNKSKDMYIRQVSYIYDTENLNDKRIMALIDELIEKEQKSCEQCKNFYKGGYFCGYSTCRCTKHGLLEKSSSGWIDLDGTNCPDFERKES